MSLLSALVGAYDRMPDAPPYGFSSEKIGFCVILNPDGSVAEVADLRDTDKKRSPRPMQVPQAIKRAVNIAPNFLWDKSAYVIGVAGESAKRVDDVHTAFRAKHLEWLAETADEGLLALRRFLETWRAEDFVSPLWSDDVRDQNLVFRLSSERGFMHDRPAARALWRRIGAEGASAPQICLVTGETAPIARLHPRIKGIRSASGKDADSLISFNAEAYESYGHSQGNNAPVSEAAAFAYTTALNRLLDRDSRHRLQIGDTSTVFWADASDMEVAAEADLWGAVMLGRPSVAGADEKIAEALIKEKLAAMRDGEPLIRIAPRLAQGVRLCVLGLAPNAARLSVRFFWEDSFGALARHYADWLRDVALEPAPDRPIFSVRAAALRSAPAERRGSALAYDAERVSPLLAGELTRAILSGNRFPRSLLGLLLLRVRSDHVLDRIRLSLIKGLIVRDMRMENRLPKRPDGSPKEDYLMHSDPDDPNPARRLGRLFAVVERAQRAALGDEINATVKDKFLGSAMATPASVFPMLLRNAEEHHIKRLRNGHSDAEWIVNPPKGRDDGLTPSLRAKREAAIIGRRIGLLWAGFPDGAPAQHSPEEQGLFLVGYYQERYAKRRADAPDNEPDDESGLAEHDNEE